MLFLVELDRVQTGQVPTPESARAFIEQIILPTLARAQGLAAENRIVTGGAVVGRIALRFIMRADSSEHLDRMITSLPIWPLAEVRVTPLIVWTFNILGSADLLHAFYEANRIGLDPGLQGAAYFIPILLVPLLLITHGLVFVLLLRKDTAAMSPVRHRAA